MNVGNFRGLEAAHDGEARGTQYPSQVRSERNDGFGADVGDDEIDGVGTNGVDRSHKTKWLFGEFNGDGIDVAGDYLSGAKESRCCREDARAGADVENSHPRFELMLQRFDTQLRGLMRAGAESHSGIHFDAKAPRRRGVVAPFGNQKETRADVDGHELRTSFGDPIARQLRFGAGAPVGKLADQRAGFTIVEEGAQGACARGHVRFRDAARSAIPQFGDQAVFFLLLALQIQREHGLGMKLQGIFADITTPFDHKGDVYKVKVQHNVENWNRTTLAGYVVCGTAGEGDLLADDEKVSVWEMVAQFAAAEKILVAAVTAQGVRPAVTLVNRAAELGYKAALVMARHATAAAQSLYLRAVADQARIPLILDSACPESGAMAHPNVTAVVGGPGTSMHAGVPVLAGSASELWPALEGGAVGAILDFAAAAPYACIAIWEAHRTRESEAGADWQNRIARAAEVVGTHGRGVAGLKHAMDLNAYYGGSPRLPFVVPDAKARREIEEAFSGFRG